MKIYINHLNLDVLPELLKLLNDNYVNSETYTQVYSIDGIYEITNSSTKKLMPVDSDIQILQNYYEKITLLVDPSYYNVEEVHQINNEHISMQMKRCFFEFNKKSKIKLVVEGELLGNEVLGNDNLCKRINKEYGIITNDMYIELPEKTCVNDALVKNEIMCVLSSLI